MPVVIHVPQPDTLARRLKAAEAPGRPWNRPAGGWIADKTALQKFVALCPFCVAKFNPRQHHYEVWRRDVLCVTRCDGCNKMDPRCRGFIHQSAHEDTGEWTRPRHRRGRWAS